MAKMDESELEAIVGAELTDAISYIDDEISPARAAATDYYLGKPFGNEEEGRSQMVSQDVRDTVNGVLPSLMRIFFSGEKVVEYVPTGPEDIKNAEQATDYANHVLQKENDGFGVIYAAFKDSLIRKCGIVKAWWDEKEEVKIVRYTGLDADTLAVLESEAETKVEVTGTTFDMVDDVDPLTGMPMQLQVPKYACTVTKRCKEGKLRIAAVPPEEFLIGRTTRDMEHAPLVAHRRMVTVSDLIAMGYKRDEVEEHISDEDFADNPEYVARTNYKQYEQGSVQNDAMRKVLYVESFIRVDYDGDGIAELRKICTLGSGFKIVANEPADMIGFALFPCDPEPHLSPLEATSLADVTMDLQRLKSDVWRTSLDALAQTITPRMAIVEGQVNVEDVMNNEVGAIIRERSAGAVRVLSGDAMAAQQGFAFLDYADTVKERRTGMSDASMGLDPNALTSVSNVALGATVTASQGKIELLSRILANGMKRLFEIMLHLMTKHQDQPKMVRLRNEWVPVDPRTWNAQMDVSINVALGTGTDQDKLNLLNMIAQKQELILTTMGANNPLVTLPQYGKTLARLVELGGMRDSSSYFNQLPADFVMPEQPEAVDPNAQATQMLAEVEMQKAQNKLETDAATIHLKQQAQEAELSFKAQQLQLERERADAEFARKELELQLQMERQAHDMNMKELQFMLSGQQKQSPVVDDPESDALQEDKIAAAIEAIGVMLAQSQQQMMSVLSAPKRVVRENGVIVGTETVNQDR